MDPLLRGDQAPLIWLPPLDPTTVIVAPAPEAFSDASSISRLTPAFRRVAVEGEYWLLNGIEDRLAAVLINAAHADTPAAVVIPLDARFASRAQAATRLWRLATGRPRRSSPDRFTRQRRRRLALTLRALDGRLAGETYREIACCSVTPAFRPAQPGRRMTSVTARSAWCEQALVS